jgi:hypothetical protein
VTVLGAHNDLGAGDSGSDENVEANGEDSRKEPARTAAPKVPVCEQGDVAVTADWEEHGGGLRGGQVDPGKRARKATDRPVIYRTSAVML